MKDRIKKVRAYRMYGKKYEKDRFAIAFLLCQLDGRIALWMGKGVLDYVRIIGFITFLKKHNITPPRIISEKRIILLKNYNSFSYKENIFEENVVMVLNIFALRGAEKELVGFKQIEHIFCLDEILTFRVKEMEEFVDRIVSGSR